MNEELREKVADALPEVSEHTRLWLIKTIRTATLDEVDESVESIDDYIHHNGFLFKRKLKERLDNLRGK